MPKGIEEMLGGGAGLEEKQKDPATAEPGVGNPLEKLDEISKAEPQKKQGSGSRHLDDETVVDMLKTGENTEGLFEPKEQGEHEDEDEAAKAKPGKSAAPSKKYEKSFKDDMLKHPDQYKVMTPKGEMTVAEAIRAGYDPITKRFSKEHGQDRLREKHLSQLNDADRQAIEGITDPAAAQVAPADAEKYGLPADSPMVRQPQPPIQGMEGLMPGQGAPTPLGGAMPGAGESTAPGGMDISSLLGGGQNGGNQ